MLRGDRARPWPAPVLAVSHSISVIASVVWWQRTSTSPSPPGKPELGKDVPAMVPRTLVIVQGIKRQ